MYMNKIEFSAADDDHFQNIWVLRYGSMKNEQILAGSSLC